MNKADLIDRVQNDLGPECSKAHAERVVNTVLSTIGTGLVTDGVVQLVGFGSFEVRERKARTGRNPQTNEPFDIARAYQWDSLGGEDPVPGAEQWNPCADRFKQLEYLAYVHRAVV